MILFAVIALIALGFFAGWRLSARQSLDHRASMGAELIRVCGQLADRTRERDSARDALTAVCDQTTLDGARAHASQALAGSGYTGRLLATLNALEAAEQEIAALLTGHPVGSVNDHADQIIDILRDDADRHEPSATGLDLTYSRTRGTS